MTLPPNLRRGAADMHESSVALSLVEVAQDVLREQGLPGPVTALTVRLGEWSSMVPEALRAAFPAAAEGTPLAGARLELVGVPGVGVCPVHGEVALDLSRGLRCPVCGERTPELIQGDELELDALELAQSELAQPEATP